MRDGFRERRDDMGERPAAQVSLSLAHELAVAVRLLLIAVRCRVLLRLRRRPRRDAMPQASSTIAYDVRGSVPRGRWTLRETLRRESAVAEALIVNCVLPVHLTMIWHGIRRRLGPDQLWSRFCGRPLDAAAFHEDEAAAAQLLNGVWPLPFEPVASASDRLAWEGRFDRYEVEGAGDLPGLRFELQIEQDVARLARIVFFPRDATAAIERSPKDGPAWLQAKQAALGIWHFLGLLHHHVAGGHFNIEQYYVALRRHLTPRNPIYGLLHPHLKGCTAVNHFADILFLGRDGAWTLAGPLSSASLQAFLRDSTASHDWKDWQPARPLTSGHVSAQAATVYDAIVSDYVDRYFELYADQIEGHWHEIEDFSRGLTEHSLRTPAGLPCVSPVIGPSRDASIRHLKHLCRYLVHWVTFEHPRLHEGHFVPYLFCQTIPGVDDADAQRNLTGARYLACLKMMALVGIVGRIVELMNVRRLRSLLRNYDGDVPELFLRLLIARRRELAAVGFDVNDLCQVVT